MTPLHVSCEHGTIEVAAFLIGECRVDVNAKCSLSKANPLHLAAENAHPEIVRLLSDAGADPLAEQADKTTPLHEAALSGCLESLVALLDAGADPNAMDWQWSTPLHFGSRLSG